MRVYTPKILTRSTNQIHAQLKKKHCRRFLLKLAAVIMMLVLNKQSDLRYFILMMYLL